MQETTEQPTLAPEAPDGLAASALQAEAWAGEPFLHPDEDPAVALAPETARRRALDDALAEIEAGAREPSYDWKIRYALMLGLERVLSQSPPKLASGTELRRHQIDALAGMLTELIAATQVEPELNGNGNGAAQPRLEPEEDEEDLGVHLEERDDELELPEEHHGKDPGASRRYRFRHPTASGKTIAAAGFVEAARTLGVLILTHRRLLVSQFNRELTAEGYGDRFEDAILKGKKPKKREPRHRPDLRLVRAPLRRPEPRGVPARDRRRGAHRARREDEPGDPQLLRPDLHRHDGDRAADRQAGLGRLPRLDRRAAARRRRAARADRAAALPARAAGRGDLVGADRRRRLRGARAGRGARPPGAEPGRREPLPRALREHARDRLRGRRRARVQPGQGVPRRRAQGRGGQRQDAARCSSPRRSPPTSAARSTS